MGGGATDDDVGVVEAWFGAWNTADADALAALYGADGTYRDVPTGRVVAGPAVAGFAREFAGALTSEPHWEVQAVVRHGSAAHAQWVLSGENRALVPGADAAGKRFTVDGVTVFELDGDRIRASADYYDQASLQRSLGGA